MSDRLRKLLGAVALIVLVLSWVLIAMVVAQFPVLRANAIVEFCYFAVAGLGWVLPAMPLIRWAFGKRAPEQSGQTADQR